MTIDTLPFERRPRNTMANNLDKINELIDYINHSTITPAWNLDASATGESVTVGNSSSLKGLDVYGKSVQDGTPTPDTPVPVQVVEGPLSLVIGDASVAIDLQGNTLASLPDGTRDELHVDSAGRMWIEKQVGVMVYSDSNFTSSWGNDTRRDIYTNILSISTGVLQRGRCLSNMFQTDYNADYAMFIQNNGNVALKFLASTGITTTEQARTLLADKTPTLYYPITPQTIDLGYIDPPAIPSGSVVTISASLTPEFRLEWWVESGITDVIEDLKAYIDYRIGE